MAGLWQSIRLRVRQMSEESAIGKQGNVMCFCCKNYSIVTDKFSRKITKLPQSRRKSSQRLLFGILPELRCSFLSIPIPCYQIYKIMCHQKQSCFRLMKYLLVKLILVDFVRMSKCIYKMVFYFDYYLQFVDCRRAPKQTRMQKCRSVKTKRNNGVGGHFQDVVTIHFRFQSGVVNEVRDKDQGAFWVIWKRATM